ncbi:MAG: substrate-binding periplasmic protein [Pseudomonadota bacterium]
MTLRSRILLLLGLLYACLAPALADTVVIAAEDDWAPYSSAAKGAKVPTGFAVDLVREAFKTQGIEVEFKVFPFARCLQQAELGKVMGCFNATIIDSNRDTYCWHPTPMFKEPLQILGQRTEQRRNLRIADLEGRKVASTVGYTYPDSFTKNPRIQHFSATSDDHLMRMLAAGRVEYALMNGTQAQMRIQADPALKAKISVVGTISEDRFWVAFTKNHPDGHRYCQTFERGLQALHASGQYTAMERAFKQRLGF